MLAVVYGIGQWLGTLPNIIRLVSGILDGIRAGNATDAICDAMTKPGELLSRVSPAGSGDNPDELPDTLIQEP
jgi:uncharacterized membrane protein